MKFNKLLTAILIATGCCTTVEAQNIANEPDSFTSTFTVLATPDQVVGQNGIIPGQPCASAVFTLRINSELDILCYNVTTFQLHPPYKSAARTATHIHQEKTGLTGPPRIALKNPDVELGNGYRSSAECIRAPFVTGINSTDGIDTGSASKFVLKSIEANPSDFAVDIHTCACISGAVRGTILPNVLQPPCSAQDEVCQVLDPGRLELPWAATNKPFAQCFNPSTHVCVKPPNSPGFFLCPNTANQACGRACFDSSIYTCKPSNINWLQSVLQSL